MALQRSRGAPRHCTILPIGMRQKETLSAWLKPTLVRPFACLGGARRDWATPSWVGEMSRHSTQPTGGTHSTLRL